MSMDISSTKLQEIYIKKNDFKFFKLKTEIFFLTDLSNVMQILKVIIEIDHYSTNSKYHQMMEYRSKK